MSSTTPLEDAIRAKVSPLKPPNPLEFPNCNHLTSTEQITAAFNPQTLEIYNDSHLHAHHKAMQGSTSKETHFR
jgi:BolA protein